MLPIDELRKLFLHKNATVYKASKGGYKTIGTVDQGYLVVMISGKHYKVAHIAWALIYGTWPAFPIHVLDGDPYNMDPDNLMAVVTVRLRYRETLRGGYYFHPLEPAVPFKDSVSCHESWIALARKHYKKDFRLVNELEQDLARARQVVPIVIKPRKPRAVGPKAPPKRPVKPRPWPGRWLYFHQNTWVSLPEPIHPSDDCMLRAAAILDGATHMELKEGKVVPVYGPAGRGAGRGDAEFIV